MISLQRFLLQESFEMVYIYLNEKIKSFLPNSLPKFINPIVIQDKKYVTYKEFKKFQKKLKLQLHKYIHRKDIILQAELNHKIELSRRSLIEKKVIQQLKDRQQYKRNNPSLADQIQFLCNQVKYQANHNGLGDQVYSAGKLMFGMCMGLVLGYVTAQSGFGVEPLWSLCAGGLIAGGIYLWNQKAKKNGKSIQDKSQSSSNKKIRRIKTSTASIQFGSGTDNNLSTINSKGKLKKR